MDYGRLGERQRGLQLPLMEIGSAILVLVAIVLGMFELVGYSNTKDSLATDLTVAGVVVGGLNESDAKARWEKIYLEQPVWLYYEDNVIELDPVNDAGFSVDSEAMLAEAREQSSNAEDFWGGFWNYLWRRPVAAVRVPLIAHYDDRGRNVLREFLTNKLAGYNDPSSPAQFLKDAPDVSGQTLVDAYTFQPGMGGRTLDVDRAMNLIEAALYDPEPVNRQVILPIRDQGVLQGDIDIQLLREAILELMRSQGVVYTGPDKVVSVYILDLETGDEVSILADVPHSGVSTVKIPIMINLFREELLLPPDAAYLLTESILCSNNSSSNLLMQLAGIGTNEEAQLRDGLNQVSCTAQQLGAEHTFISAPLDVGDRNIQFEVPVCRPQTPANTTYYTAPDPYSQTTAEDMGLLLTLIYDCAQYGSGLMAVYPEDITQTECQQMIEVMSGNRIDRLIELGVPFGTKIAHKNGWGPVTSADGGIVFSPGGDYVFVMYIYEPDTDGNQLPTLPSWELIEEVSRLTYNYFNPDAPLTVRRPPISAFGAIDCVTVMSPDDVNLNDIDENRLDENGNPLPTACYGGAGDCRPFDNWGQ